MGYGIEIEYNYGYNQNDCLSNFHSLKGKATTYKQLYVEEINEK